MDIGGYMKKKSLPALVELVQQNNEEAFNELYRRYYKLVRYIAFGMTKSDADTDEIVQEVFIQVQKSIKNLKEPELFKSWLSRITYSKTKMLFRNHKDRPMEDEYLDLLQHQEEVREDFIPRRKQRHNHDLEILYKCIQKLKPDFREVLLFYYFSQMSIKEIAEVTGNPEGTVKSRLLYAKKYLKTEVEEYEKETGEHITFHGKSLEAALSLCGLSLIESAHKPILSFNHITIPSSTFLMVAKLSLASVLAFGGAYTFYDYNNRNNQENIPNQVPPNTEQNKTTKEFIPVEYQGIIITTPKDAYKTLITWADCEVEMRDKTKEELKEANKLYQSLMQFGEGYAQLLERRSWDTAFESYVEK